VTAKHRDAGDALRLVERQARLARTARSRAAPEQWMRTQETGPVLPD